MSDCSVMKGDLSVKGIRHHCLIPNIVINRSDSEQYERFRINRSDWFGTDQISLHRRVGRRHFRVSRHVSCDPFIRAYLSWDIQGVKSLGIAKSSRTIYCIRSAGRSFCPIFTMNLFYFVRNRDRNSFVFGCDGFPKISCGLPSSQISPSAINTTPVETSRANAIS